MKTREEVRKTGHDYVKIRGFLSMLEFGSRSTPTGNLGIYKDNRRRKILSLHTLKVKQKESYSKGSGQDS